MVRISTLNSNPRKERRDIIISLSLALYVFSNYWIRIPRLMLLGSLVLYLFLGITIFKLITNQTPIKFTLYSAGYLAFGLLGMFSSLYALDRGYVSEDLYLLLVSWTLTFSYIQYVHNSSGFFRIFAFYAYFPILLLLYLVASGTLQNPGQRLGDYEFGNANNLAIVMMVTLCCIFWFLIYGKKKWLLPNIALAIAFLYVVSLTGGRKYLILPFIFLFLILLFKYWRENKSKLIIYITLFTLLVLLGVWALIEIPILYSQVGYRFEGLLNFAKGDIYEADSSTLIRAFMIENGWRWFLWRPIQGYGLNNYGVLIADIMGSHVYAHNNFVELMVDLGLMGLIVYYTIYCFIIVKLINIKDDGTGIRNFFLAYMLCLFIFEVGAVTYQLYIIQIFIGLASAYIWLYEKNRRAFVYEQIPSQ